MYNDAIILKSSINHVKTRAERDSFIKNRMGGVDIGNGSPRNNNQKNILNASSPQPLMPVFNIGSHNTSNDGAPPGTRGTSGSAAGRNNALNQLTFGQAGSPQHHSPRAGEQRSENNSVFKDIIPGGNGNQAQTLDLHRQKSASPQATPLAHVDKAKLVNAG